MIAVSLNLLSQSHHVYSSSSLSQPSDSISTPDCDPPLKKKKRIPHDKDDQLPEPCPLLAFSERIKAIIGQGLKGNNQFYLCPFTMVYVQVQHPMNM